MDSSQNFISIIRNIITNYGQPSEENVKIYISLLSDYFVDFPREKNILTLILEDGLLFRIIREKSVVPCDIQIHNRITDLNTTYGIDEKVARWGVETWIKALGIYSDCIDSSDVHKLKESEFKRIPNQILNYQGQGQQKKFIKEDKKSNFTRKAENNETPIGSNDNPKEQYKSDKYNWTNKVLLFAIFIAVIMFIVIFSGLFNSPQTGQLVKQKPNVTVQSDNILASQPACNPGPSCNCENATLIGHYLSDYGLKKANFRNADLSGAKLNGAKLLYADLSYAKIEGADLTDALLIGAILVNADLKGAKLISASTKNANLSGADMSEAIIQSTDLSSTDLRGANFYHASMDDHNSFMESDLSGAKWTNGHICSEQSLGYCK